MLEVLLGGQKGEPVGDVMGENQEVMCEVKAHFYFNPISKEKMTTPHCLMVLDFEHL